MVTPHTMVALAPTVAFARIKVGVSPAPVFLIYARGFMSLVKTQFGPRKTLSSTVTRSQMATPFLTVTLLPRTTPDSIKAWSPILQLAPTRAPSITWAKAQMKVFGPIWLDSTRACGCAKYFLSTPVSFSIAIIFSLP